MKIAGRGLTEVSTKEGADWFKSVYNQSHFELLVDYQIFRVSTVTAEQYKYIMFVDPGGGVKRVIQLEPGDRVVFYAQLELEGYSNTSGIGFVRAYEKTGKYEHTERAMFALEDSPYDVPPDDDQFDDIITEHSAENEGMMVRFFGEDVDNTHENTLYISCL